MIWDARKLSDRDYHRRRFLLNSFVAICGTVVVATEIWGSTFEPATTRHMILAVFWTAYAIWFGSQARKEWLEMKAHG